ASDLRLRASLRLVRQVDVFEARLGVGGHDLSLEGVVELALAANGLEDRGSPLLELAQVAQSLLELAQLRVVEHFGDFLAVSSNERHRRAAVEELNGRQDLPFAHAKFFGDALRDA